MGPRGGTAVRTLWAGTGSSDAVHSYRAGAEAAAAATDGRSGAVLFLFVPADRDLVSLVAGARSVVGATPIVGCTTAGEIAAPRAGSVGVVAFAVGGDAVAVRTAAAHGASADLRAAGVRVAEEVLSTVPGGGRQLLLLLSDGLAGDQQELLRGAYSVAEGAIPLVGGCAGDDLRMRRTRQIHGDDVLTDAVVAVGLTLEGPVGIGVGHGWTEVGEPMVVTASSGTRVRALDDQPALDAYLERLRPPASAAADAEAFARFAQTHPLGLQRRAGVSIRFIAGADFDSRELVCLAQVPEGGLAYLMRGDERSILDGADQACREALAQLGGVPPAGMLAFDCIARRGVLGAAGVLEEARRLSAGAGGAPVAGFYTYGEFARTHGMSGFHNQTLVVVAFG
ncbi:MAG TPA: FIST N-terminal domain-containing protein [Acidimicrobiales bacterium]|nr:FIST N-terminal domain-containing protein [Acidimicrobiales bacterium]